MAASLRDRRPAYCLPLFFLAAFLAGCSSVSLDQTPAAPSASVPPTARAPSSRPLPALPPARSGRGGYYQDDGPGDAPPDGLMDTPDAEPRVEPYSRYGNRPYVVFGKTYTPFTDDRPYKESGLGSWYGRKYHGQKTSSGEIYDMYQMTAAHPTLPIPSYARVTNLNNGRQVIVRVNDRGPFLANRIIDLSYTAALKLGYLEKGSGRLQVERLLPDEINRLAQLRRDQPAAEAAQADTGPVAVVASAIDFPVLESGSIAAQLPLQPVPAATVDSAQATSSAPLAPAGAGAARTEPVAPSVTARAPATDARATAAVAGKGIYLQFGAYAQQSNALLARDRLLQDLSGVITTLEAVMVDGLHRLHAGPYASREAAQDVLRRVQQASAQRPLIVER